MKYDIIENGTDSVIRERKSDKEELKKYIIANMIYVKADNLKEINRYNLTISDNNRIVIGQLIEKKAEINLTETAYYCLDHEYPKIIGNPYQHAEEHLLNQEKEKFTKIEEKFEAEYKMDKITPKDIKILKDELIKIKTQHLMLNSESLLFQSIMKINILSEFLITCAKLCKNLNEMELFEITENYNPIYSYQYDVFSEKIINQLLNSIDKFEFNDMNQALKWCVSLDLNVDQLDIIWKKTTNEQKKNWLNIAKTYGNSNIEEKVNWSITAYHHVVTEELSRFDNVFLRSQYYIENKKTIQYPILNYVGYITPKLFQASKELNINEGNLFELISEQKEELDKDYGFHEYYYLVKTDLKNEELLEKLKQLYHPLINDISIYPYSNLKSEYLSKMNTLIAIKRYFSPELFESAKKGSIEISHEKIISKKKVSKKAVKEEAEIPKESKIEGKKRIQKILITDEKINGEFEIINVKKSFGDTIFTISNGKDIYEMTNFGSIFSFFKDNKLVTKVDVKNIRFYETETPTIPKEVVEPHSKKTSKKSSVKTKKNIKPIWLDNDLEAILKELDGFKDWESYIKRFGDGTQDQLDQDVNNEIINYLGKREETYIKETEKYITDLSVFKNKFIEFNKKLINEHRLYINFHALFNSDNTSYQIDNDPESYEKLLKEGIIQSQGYGNFLFDYIGEFTFKDYQDQINELEKEIKKTTNLDEIENLNQDIKLINNDLEEVISAIIDNIELESSNTEYFSVLEKSIDDKTFKSIMDFIQNNLKLNLYFEGKRYVVIIRHDTYVKNLVFHTNEHYPKELLKLLRECEEFKNPDMQIYVISNAQVNQSIVKKSSKLTIKWNKEFVKDGEFLVNFDINKFPDDNLHYADIIRDNQIIPTLENFKHDNAVYFKIFNVENGNSKYFFEIKKNNSGISDEKIMEYINSELDLDDGKYYEKVVYIPSKKSSKKSKGELKPEDIPILFDKNEIKSVDFEKEEDFEYILKKYELTHKYNGKDSMGAKVSIYVNPKEDLVLQCDKSEYGKSLRNINVRGEESIVAKLMEDIIKSAKWKDLDGSDTSFIEKTEWVQIKSEKNKDLASEIIKIIEKESKRADNAKNIRKMRNIYIDVSEYSSNEIEKALERDFSSINAIENMDSIEIIKDEEKQRFYIEIRFERNEFAPKITSITQLKQNIPIQYIEDSRYTLYELVDTSITKEYNKAIKNKGREKDFEINISEFSKEVINDVLSEGKNFDFSSVNSTGDFTFDIIDNKKLLIKYEHNKTKIYANEYKRVTDSDKPIQESKNILLGLNHLKEPFLSIDKNVKLILNDTYLIKGINYQGNTGISIMQNSKEIYHIAQDFVFDYRFDTEEYSEDENKTFFIKNEHIPFEDEMLKQINTIIKKTSSKASITPDLKTYMKFNIQTINDIIPEQLNIIIASRVILKFDNKETKIPIILFSIQQLDELTGLMNIDGHEYKLESDWTTKKLAEQASKKIDTKIYDVKVVESPNKMRFGVYSHLKPVSEEKMKKLSQVTKEANK